LGVDFELPEGADLFATNSGRVIRVGQNRAAGKYVVLRHENGMESYYNHMHTIAKNLRVGSQIASGQLLGTVGCTGYCTKPHLHFALKKKGRFVDPVPYLKSYPYPHKSLIARHMAALSEENN
jgi:murein DD-endopeptidase MepM/ murein hydrolase activator NlpD